MHYRAKTSRDTSKNVLVIMGVTAFFLAFILLSYFVLRSSSWLILVPILTLANGFLIVFAMTKWQINTFGYECPSCKHQFDITLLTAFAYPAIWDKKLLRCPACGKKGWAQEVVKVKS